MSDTKNKTETTYDIYSKEPDGEWEFHKSSFDFEKAKLDLQIRRQNDALLAPGLRRKWKLVKKTTIVEEVKV